jgi:dienelactone hydrolase
MLFLNLFMCLAAFGATEQVQVTLPNKQVLSAKINKPDLVQKNVKLPVLLVFGGFEEAKKVLDRVRPSKPALVASFDYPYLPPRKFIFPESLKYAPEAKRAVRDTVSGIQMLHQILLQRSDVDPKRVTLVGASFGAPFVIAAAAQDPSITGLVLVHGFGDIPNTVVHQLMRKWPAKYGIFAKPMAWILSHAGWLYLDAHNPEDSAENLSASQRVLMLTAKEDTFIPSASRESLWSALTRSQAQHERIDMPGDHLQPGAEKLISEISGIVTKWMEKTGLL